MHSYAIYATIELGRHRHVVRCAYCPVSSSGAKARRASDLATTMVSPRCKSLQRRTGIAPCVVATVSSLDTRPSHRTIDTTEEYPAHMATAR